jgi:hypothetical protein
MISAEFQAGRALPVLASLLDSKLASKAANAAAKSYKTDVLGYVRGGAAFMARQGGPLEKSIRWAAEGPGAKVYTRAKHAAIMEGGSRPHAIGPKGRRKRKTIRFDSGAAGGRLFRKLVQHPGTQPMPFFFADMSARQGRIADAVAGILAGKLAGAK